MKLSGEEDSVCERYRTIRRGLGYVYATRAQGSLTRVEGDICDDGDVFTSKGEQWKDEAYTLISLTQIDHITTREAKDDVWFQK